MLIDMHAHTSAISKCCRVNGEKVICAAKDVGIDGIVLTNHFQKSYLRDISEYEFVNAYIQEYYSVEKLSQEKNFKVYFGIEVTMELYQNIHLLIYGVKPSFIERYPKLYDYTQKELYEIVKENNGILIQAHPYRNGTNVLDVNFLDGVEINCHPKYKKSYAEELIKIAKDNSLCITCGGDYHADTYRPKCGMYIPDTVKSSIDLTKYIIGDDNIFICVHEPNFENAVDIKL